MPWLGILIFFVALSPWPIRNQIVMHSFVPLRSNFGYELWLGNHPGGDGNTPQFASPMNNSIEQHRFLALGELGYMHEKGMLARTYIAAHPAEFLRLCSRRFMSFWIGNVREPAAMITPLALLNLAGLVLLWRRRQTLLLFALPLVIYPLPYYITHPDVRYQFVLDPLLAILAAHACETFLHAMAPKSSSSSLHADSLVPLAQPGGPPA
jgi:hypothetical protein